MQKIRKILRAVSEKTALPTNQPTNQLLPTTPILCIYIYKICFDYSLDFLVVVEILKCNFKPEMAVSFNALRKLTEEDL